MKQVLGFLVVTALAFSALVVLSYAFPAQALSDPFSQVRVFQVSCGTTATLIRPSDAPRSKRALRVWNNSTTPIYLGGSDVTGGLTKGWPVCTDTSACEQASFPLDASGDVYCRTASGSVTTQVFFGG